LATHRYLVVDVFAHTPLEGNPAAVFPASADLAPGEMQAIACELNLSETTFICPPTRAGCVARLRIFTPQREMRFAGHPTVGASFVLWRQGMLPAGTDRFALDEPVGAVPILIEPGDPPLIWLETPPVTAGRLYDPALCARALGLDASDVLDATTPQMLSAGNPIVVIALRSRDAVDRAQFDLSGDVLLRGSDSEPVCTYVFAPSADGAYGRMFAPSHGIAEDPATGSAMGPLAVFMAQHGLLEGTKRTRFICEQGTRMGRRSLLHIRRGAAPDAPIEVGGCVTPVIEATLTL